MWCIKWNRCFNFNFKSLNLKRGDEIITTAHTAVATVASIVEVGAIPVFVDIDESFNIDINKLNKKLIKN